MSEAKVVGAEDLLGSGTWVRQGPATLVIRGNAWVVLVPGLRKQVTEAAWDLLGSSPDPEQFFDALVEAGGIESAEKLSALLFGFHDGTNAIFGVKGTTPIAVYTPEGSQQIAGTDEEPFVLKTVEGVRRTAFGDLPAEDSLGAPRLSSGVIPVRGFVHVTEDPAELGEADRAELAEQVEKDGRSIESPEAKKRRTARPTPAPKPAGSSAATPLARPATATRKPGEMPPSISRGGARGGSTLPASSAAAATGPNLFAGLFGNRSATPGPAAQAEPPAPAPAPAHNTSSTSTSTSTRGPAGRGAGSTGLCCGEDAGSFSRRRRRGVLGVHPDCCSCRGLGPSRAGARDPREAAIGQHFSVRPRPPILHRDPFGRGDHSRSSRCGWHTC